MTIVNDALFVLTDLVYVPSSETVSQDTEGHETLVNNTESETVSRDNEGRERL